MSETRIVSFVLRFVRQTGPEEEPLDGLQVTGVEEGGPLAMGWHGVVRHVQSREEVRFTRVEEALAFINRYVILQEEEKAGKDPRHPNDIG